MLAIIEHSKFKRINMQLESVVVLWFAFYYNTNQLSVCTSFKVKFFCLFMGRQH